MIVRQQHKREEQMEKQSLLNLLVNTSDEDSQIYAARRLHKYCHDRGVLNLLCTATVDAINEKLRDALIKTLKLSPEKANGWFKNCAMNSLNPAQRRRALIVLSLMECQTAKEAVIQGLQDSNRSVRIGAALNAGLYYDKDVIKALENYFERNPLDFTWELFVGAVKKVRSKKRKINRFANDILSNDRNFPENYLQNSSGKKPSVGMVAES